DHRRRADALLANRDPRDRIARGGIEPMYDPGEIGHDDAPAIHHGRRELAPLERLLPPLLGAGASIEPHEIALGGRDIDRIGVDGEAAKTRQIAGPDNL